MNRGAECLRDVNEVSTRRLMSVWRCGVMSRRPAAKFPTSKAEVIMMSVAEGDVKGVWFELSPFVFKASAPVVAASLLLQTATRGSLDGVLGGLQQTAEVLLVLTTLTEIIKLVGQLGL